MKLSYILLCLTALANCKPGTSEQCNDSEVRASLSQIAKDDLNNQKNIDRLGGYLNVRFNPSFLEGHRKLIEKIESDPEASGRFVFTDLFRSSVYGEVFKDHSCTALFDFLNSSGNQLKLYIWTSRHCLPFPFVENLSLQISTSLGYIKVPLQTEFNLPEKNIGQYLSIDFDAFLSFFLFIKSNELRRPPIPVIRPEKVNEAVSGLLPYLNSIVAKQQEVYLRGICNSFTGNEIQIKNFAVAKLCFNLKDLMVISGEIDVSHLAEDQRHYLIQQIKKSVLDRSEYFSKSKDAVKKFASWRNAIELISLSNYADKISNVNTFVLMRCRQGGLIDEGNLCDDATSIDAIKKESIRAAALVEKKVEMVKLPEYLGVKKSESEGFPIADLVDYQSIISHYIQPLWIDLISTVGGIENLYIHTNVYDEVTKKSFYKSLSYLEMIKGTDFPPIFQPLGFAHLMPNDYVKFTKSDSGSVVTVGGYYPMITLSTVNDDEISGGYGDHPVQDYESGDKEEKQAGSPDLSQKQGPEQADSNLPDDRIESDPKNSDSTDDAYPSASTDSPDTPSIYDEDQVVPAENSLAGTPNFSSGSYCARQ